MSQRNVESVYQEWLENVKEPTLLKALEAMRGDEAAIEDAFYQELAFGTGGLRQAIGVGSNRMNIYTVGKATKGLAKFMQKTYGETCSIAISYDTRNMSKEFARHVALIMADMGINAYLYPSHMPTPCLSFATRYMNCQAGVMITASHNPAIYNGYKVYGPDGCQITTDMAKAITEEIGKVDVFEGKVTFEDEDFEQFLAAGKISYMPEEVYEAYLVEVEKTSLLSQAEREAFEAKILYSPIHGAGYIPVTDVLRRMGYKHLSLVEEQIQPDGNFPTAPYPNPEEPEAMALGLAKAKEIGADLLFATDPDCDRLGVACKNQAREMQLLSGNQVGCLLLDYICQMLVKKEKMPANPVFVKTIVTSDLARAIAEHYGAKSIDVLTGFKYIGEQIAILEEKNREDDFLFAFEESCGYLSGTYVRDKDAVNASVLTAEMFSYYQEEGKNLFDRLAELYAEYGYAYEDLHVYTFKGSAGQKTMAAIMDAFREEEEEMAGWKIQEIKDYDKGLGNFTKSDVLQIYLEEDISFVLRPSGTEPKLKLYTFVSAKDQESAQAKEQRLVQYIEDEIAKHENV